MTRPRELSDLLMLEASRNRSPAAPELFCRSLPAQDHIHAFSARVQLIWFPSYGSDRQLLSPRPCQ